jgi:hypothetical protein
VVSLAGGLAVSWVARVVSTDGEIHVALAVNFHE